MRLVVSLVPAALAALALGFAAPAEDPSEAASFGPALGDDISAVVVSPDAFGVVGAIEDWSGPSGLVLVFSRSVDWCPFCKAQAIALDQSYEDLEQRGYGLAILTTDDLDALDRYVEEREPKLTLISDADSAVIRTLGLLDPTYPEGHRRHGVPYPTTLVLSPEGVVQAKLLLEAGLGEEGGYRERVEVVDVLAAIDALD